MSSLSSFLERDHPVLFAARNRHLSYRGTPMTFETKPFAVEMFAQLHRFRELAIQKAVQTGQTEMCLCLLLLAAGSWGRTCVYSLPTTGILNQFVGDRIDRHLTGNPEYRRILTEPGARTRRGQAPARGQSELDNLSIKHFGRGTLMFRAGMVPRDWVEYSADLMILDEMEHFPPNVLQLAKDRLLASPTPQFFQLSNPILPKSGICREYLIGDQRRYFFACPACGKQDELDFFRHVAMETERGWVARDRARATGKEDLRPVCDHCHTPFPREEGFGLHGNRRGGIWVAAYPGRVRASYRLSRLFALDHSLRATLEEWKIASPTEESRSRMVRSIFGQGYEPADMSLSEAVLFASAVAPNLLSPGDPPPPGFRYCGMDVGATHHMDFQVEESEEDSPEGEADAGKPSWKVRTFHLHAARSFDDALARLKAFRVHVVVVDANPEGEGARKFQKACADAGISCWLCTFQTNPDGTTFGLKLNPSEGRLSVDRTRAFDHAFEWIRSGQHAYPVDVTGIHGFVSQMQEPKRLFLKSDKPNVADRFIWTKAGPDHYRLAGVYAATARASRSTFGDFVELGEARVDPCERHQARHERERERFAPRETPETQGEEEELYSDTFFEV